jgi:hypothetical protein
MSLTASEGGDGNFELTPEGVYTARCYRIIDLGTQTTEYMGESKQQHKVMISWELIGKDDERMKEGENKGKPFSIHKRYTVSLSDKANLRADLEAWRGKKFSTEELHGFDLSNVLGAYCTIQVVHSEDKKYANVNSIMAFKGEKPEPVNPDLVFDIDNPDMQIYETLSENMKQTIAKAPEWKGSTTVATPSEDGGKDVVIEDAGEEINLDDIPF